MHASLPASLDKSRRSLTILIAVLTVVSACALLAGASPTGAAVSGSAPSGQIFRVWPSGHDATNLQAALDAASVAAPGAVVQLSAGTFHVARPLVGLNFSGTIRGAGMRRTIVLADGSTNPDGLFTDNGIYPKTEALLFSFKESSVDRFGHQLSTRRSQDITMEDLTLGATGRTEAHYDINVDANTQRLFSLVWIAGFRPEWTNSSGQTPADTGSIDADQSKISTVRATFARVHFDGRNAARTNHEPGGPFDPHPDVRNAFGIEGGLTLLSPPPDPVFFFKPINAALAFNHTLFTDLPGQAAIFAPQLVGPRDHAWRFGPDAVAAGIKVAHSTFMDTPNGVIAGDLSDADVLVEHSVFQRTDYGVSLWTNYQATDGAAIGYPKAVADSQVTISGSRFQNARVAAVWMDEYQGPSHVSFLTRRNTFRLADPSQVGVLANSVDKARFIGNDFSGIGYGALVAVTSHRWTLEHNNFCDLTIPPSASASPELGLPPNETQKPIVLFDSAQFQKLHNHCG